MVPFLRRRKRSAALSKKKCCIEKPTDQCGCASCVVSVQVVIIRKSITTAATLQQLLIIGTFDNLVIGQSITRNIFFGLVVCFLLVVLAAPILPERKYAGKKTDPRSDADLFGKGSDIWLMKKGFRDFPTTRSDLPTPENRCLPFLLPADPLVFPSLSVITILAPTPQHWLGQVSAAEIWDEIKLRLK